MLNNKRKSSFFLGFSFSSFCVVCTAKRIWRARSTMLDLSSLLSDLRILPLLRSSRSEICYFFVVSDFFPAHLLIIDPDNKYPPSFLFIHAFQIIDLYVIYALTTALIQVSFPAYFDFQFTGNWDLDWINLK